MAQLSIIKRQTIKGLQGVSGIEYIAPNVYMVADNSMYLYHSTLDFSMLHAQALSEQTIEAPLIPIHKKIKPDYESMAAVEWQQQQHLMLFGSGSTANRMTGLMFNLSNSNTQIIANPATYAQLMHYPNFTNGAELNIEAACANDLHTFLFQRGNINRHNGVIQLQTDCLIQTQDIAQSVTDCFSIASPDINGYASGISGASWIASIERFVLTCSVEATDNTYDDGAVLGSFVGISDIPGFAVQWYPLLDAHLQHLPIKVEGVSLIDETIHTDRSRTLELLLSTDSDGGDSELLTVLLQLDA